MSWVTMVNSDHNVTTAHGTYLIDEEDPGIFILDGLSDDADFGSLIVFETGILSSGNHTLRVGIQ
jgi:hypothetical protein